jgi:transcriptional regulator with XRE-family HTH domain
LVKVSALARIRRWRLLTQSELAERAGIAVVTLSRLENGGEGTVRTVRRLARALEVSPYDLTETDPARPPGPPPAQAEARDQP